MKFVSTIIILCFAFTQAHSENTMFLSEEEQIKKLRSQPLNGFFGLAFVNAVPQKEFKNNIRSTGLGFSIFGGKHIMETPLIVGFECEVLFFGGEEKIFRYQQQGGWTVASDTVSSSSVVIPLNTFLRLQPNQGFLLPYFEGFAGVSFFSASADYKSHWGVQDTKSKFSAAFNYGFGVGFMVKLLDFINLPDEYATMNLDVRMRYNFGTEAKYFTVKILDDTSPVFTEHRSKTDKILTTVGITFRF